jgi:UDP-N-acetylglucosamine 2-epimerase (non-hydrolysing)
MKVSVIIGTRPEIIKMAPVIRELQAQGVDFFILHTGQHYSYNLDRIFFEELELLAPKYNLDAGSGTHGEETGKMLIGIEKTLLQEKPDIVLVEGDTNSVLAGALAAAKLHIKVGHVEAGLRSYDRNMPEELNRVLTDHLSDYLFAPTEEAKHNLVSEGIPKERIIITGNTIVDAVYQNLDLARGKSRILNVLGLKQNGYFLVTAHRQENVDVRGQLQDMFEGFRLVYERFHLPLFYPIHPRARRKLEEFRLEIPPGLRFIEPTGFLDFLLLEANAASVLTDSGGVQEETCILKVPCVTLRDNTERPETLQVGSNILAGTSSQRILDSVDLMLSRERNWRNPFGDGKAGNRIVEAISIARQVEERR